MRPAAFSAAVVVVMLAGVLRSGAAVAVESVRSAACGTALTASEVAAIVELSDMTTVTGSSMVRLERAVARHGRIAGILMRHRDRRGLLPLGLDAVERAAVLPLQRASGTLVAPEWAHRLSLDLIVRFLRNLHAEFIGAAVQPHWARYFELTARCELSAARVAMAGYNAHLAVDLSHAVAATGGTAENARDYFTLVDAIARHGNLIVARTKEVYGGDLGPLWRFYFLGEGLDRLFGPGVATGPMLRAADLGANAVIFGNGLALQNPTLAPATRTQMDLLWRSADSAFDILARSGGL